MIIGPMHDKASALHAVLCFRPQSIVLHDNIRKAFPEKVVFEMDLKRWITLDQMENITLGIWGILIVMDI